MAFEDLDHPSFFSVGGATLGYLAILAVMFVLLFVVPYLAFAIPP